MQLHRSFVGPVPRRAQAAAVVRAQPTSSASSKDFLARVPSSYELAVRMAQDAAKAALADGRKLLEIEFPSSSLLSVSGASPLTTVLRTAHRSRSRRGPSGAYAPPWQPLTLPPACLPPPKQQQ
jgi:hypothetical protein